MPIWKITAFNGTTWTVPYPMDIAEAIVWFCNDTKLHLMDIKIIENLH